MPAAHEKKFLHAILASGAEYDAVEKIRSSFPSYEAAWRSERAALAHAGLSPERIEALLASREGSGPDEEMRKLVAQGIAFITRDDADFPENLREIHSPPAALYIKGRLAPGKPHLAVVGTRKATTYGREATEKIIRDLARDAEVVIVSGLAQGIDTEAHRAALSNGLPTIAILGGGIDRETVFPPENWRLAEDIVAKGGAVISEYPPGAPALKHHFPARNRIIAGLAIGTLVVEAPEHSGALITARHALEEGREVFAVPGQMFSPNALGAHRLIQDGAKLITTADDIIEELGLARRSRGEEAAVHLTDTTEQAILKILAEPANVDEIKLKTDLPTPSIVSCLSALELKGFVRAVGQNRFQKIS